MENSYDVLFDILSSKNMEEVADYPFEDWADDNLDYYYSALNPENYY